MFVQGSYQTPNELATGNKKCHTLSQVSHRLFKLGDLEVKYKPVLAATAISPIDNIR